MHKHGEIWGGGEWKRKARKTASAGTIKEDSVSRGRNRKKITTMSVLQFNQAVSITPYERVVLLLCFKMSFLIAKITEVLCDCSLSLFEGVNCSLIKKTEIIMDKL